MDKILTVKSSHWLIIIGGVLIILGLCLFTFKDQTFSVFNDIAPSKVGQFGDFVGGLAGSIWALAGVIMFYVALKEQREDFKTNKDVLLTQTKALEQQIKEFELQRKELEETREVFKIQSETLKLQQFETTFFSLLNLHHEIVNGIDIVKRSERRAVSPDITTGRDCFGIFYRGLKTRYEQNLKKAFSSELELATKSYIEYYHDHQADLGHYFRNLYHILKFVNTSEIENKHRYSNFIRAQLSSHELLLLFYNGIAKYGKENFKPLIEEYHFLKNMAPDSLIKKEHIKFYNISAFKKPDNNS